MMLLPALLAAAHAGSVTSADADAVLARLAEIQPLLPQRVADDAPSIPESAWREAAAGEVATGVAEVPGQRSKIGWGVAVVDVPIDQLWRGLNEELENQDLLGLGHVEIVEGGRCEDGRRVMMLLPLPIVSDRWWVVQNTYNAGISAASEGRVRELRWRDVDDPTPLLSAAAREAVDGAVQVAFNTGAWLLVDLDGRRTLAEYHAWSDPGGELPAGAASSFANATIASTVEGVADWAASHPGACR